MQWSAKEAAEFLKIPEETLHEWIQERGLPTVFFNEHYHFSRLRLTDWALENRVPVFARGERRYPSLLKSLQAGGVHRGVPGKDLPEILKNLVERLPLPEGTDRDLLWRLLTARERDGATALGHGIAVPHARHPILLDVETPLLALCYPGGALALPTPDEVPVTALFVLVAPNIQSHLHYLGRLSRLLRDASVLQAVQEGRSGEDFFAILEEAEGALLSSDGEGNLP